MRNVFRRSDIVITVYSLDNDASSSKPQTSVADMFSRGEKSKENQKEKEKSKEKRESKKSPAKKKSVGFGWSTSNPLPDVFTEVRVHLVDGVEDAETLGRYLEAYGGELVSEQSEATHVVYPDGASTKKFRSKNSTIKHVKSSWLEDSIKLKTLQDERLYKVKEQK